MILAFHSIFSTYGFWLPNDPRGSWSDYVASWELFRYGPATKTDTRRSVAAAPHNRTLRKEAKQALKHPPVEFTGIQARAVAHGMGRAIDESGYLVFACAILPDQVHVVIGANPRCIRRIIGHLNGRATHALIEEGLWNDRDRPVWAEGGWNVYIDSVEYVHAAIQYVNANPEKEGKKRQHWSFVKPYAPYLI
jgi:hypothetical protein